MAYQQTESEGVMAAGPGAADAVFVVATFWRVGEVAGVDDYPASRRICSSRKSPGVTMFVQRWIAKFNPRMGDLEQNCCLMRSSPGLSIAGPGWRYIDIGRADQQFHHSCQRSQVSLLQGPFAVELPV